MEKLGTKVKRPERKGKKKEKHLAAGILLCMVTLAVFMLLGQVISMRYMDQIYESGKLVIDTYEPVNAAWADIETTYQDYQKTMYAYCTAPSEKIRSSLSQKLIDSSDKITALLDTIDSKDQILSEDTEYYSSKSQFKEAFQTFVVSLQEAKEQADRKNRNGAISTLWAYVNKDGENLDTAIIKIRESVANDIQRAEDLQAESYRNIKNMTKGYVGMIILVVLLSISKVILGLARPLRRSARELRTYVKEIENGNGDLSVRMKIYSKDEVGTLVGYINRFVDILQKLLGDIKREDENLLQSVSCTTESTEKMSRDLRDTSDSIQIVTGSMQEINASLEELSQNVDEVTSAAKNMRESAEEGSRYADAFKLRAAEGKNEAVENKEKTHRMLGQIKAALEKSVENSKQVHQINQLTEQILSIASQTNLLALNASIEAAHAGEAGKGFAVVAEEIRVLAETTKTTANNIQDISTVVKNSVEDLNKNSDDMMNYMNEYVLEDYEKFVTANVAYDADADVFKNHMDEFAGKAVDFAEILNQILQSVVEIGKHVEEGNIKLEVVSNKSEHIIDIMKDINYNMETNRAIVQVLDACIHKFKKIS